MSNRRFAFFLGLCAILFNSPSSAAVEQNSDLQLVQREKIDERLAIELRQSDSESQFVLVGLTDDDGLQKLDHDVLVKLFCPKVYDANETNERPALLGTYQYVSNELRFLSRFPLSPNVQYRVELDLTQWPKRLAASGDAIRKQGARRFVFTPRRSERAAPVSVVSVFPSANVLPENVLRFYIHFSAPMSRGEAYDRIHLFHGDQLIESPFLELGEELWNADQTRFTLFIHPGRIKRGVKPREDNGLPLAQGKEYSLVIDPEWKAADRKPLQSKHVKKFRTVASDDEQPDPTKWKLATPKPKSLEPVSLTFNESLDHAMLQRVLNVLDASGAPVEGKIEVVDKESVWRFRPTNQWSPGEYSIEVATNLEDLAGNSLARPFESKLRTDAVGTHSAPKIAIQFVVE